MRLAPFPADGHLGIAEGIETALSAGQLFGVPVWAALSADGLRRWAGPEGTERITIFADAGDAGRQAAAVLADRLNAANIPNTIIAPLHGDDFNDDLRMLHLDLSGTPERNEANVITALTNDEAFAGALVFDEFAQEVRVNRRLPWDEAGAPLPRPWEDADDVRCAEWLQRREINVAPAIVGRSVAAVARDIRVHPVRDYLTSLVWDGMPRLERWVVSHLGAADSALNRAFGSLWMVSAVARIMQPGCKADHMLTLEGPQGMTDPELIAQAGAEQEARFQSDAWDELIERWLVTAKQRVNKGYGGYDVWRDEEVAGPAPLTDVGIGEILREAIGLDPAKWTRADQMRIGTYLKRNGWERYRTRVAQALEWRYRR